MSEPVWEGGWWDIQTAPVTGYCDLWHKGGYRVPDACRAVSGQRNVGWIDSDGHSLSDGDVTHWRASPEAPRVRAIDTGTVLGAYQAW